MSFSAKKSFGQNFLNAPSVVANMLVVSKIIPGDTVIEVGPGKGVLTKSLLEQGARVIAFEIDSRMIEYLSHVFQSELRSGMLTLIEGDILEQDLGTIIGDLPYKLVANIPYYITNAILRYFLEHTLQPLSACLLVQHEVAERITRDPKESLLSLSVKAYGVPRYVTKVGRRYFNPQPKVDSAVLFIDQISRKNFHNPDHEQRFFAMIKLGFAHRRKQLLSNITETKDEREVWIDELAHRGYQPYVRAEDITVQDWLWLSCNERINDLY